MAPVNIELGSSVEVSASEDGPFKEPIYKKFGFPALVDLEIDNLHPKATEMFLRDEDGQVHKIKATWDSGDYLNDKLVEPGEELLVGNESKVKGIASQ